MPDMLPSLGAFILDRYNAPGDQLDRMEALPWYSSGSDGGDFDAWKAGAPGPTSPGRLETEADLAAERDNGQVRRRVRILSAELTDYERYSIEFAYLRDAAILGVSGGVRVLRRGEHQIPTLLGFEYWMVNSRDLARMHYDDEHRFVGAEAVPRLARKARREFEACWEAGEDVATYWARHPELHRQLTG